MKNVLLALFHYVRGWAKKGIELLGEDWQYKLFFLLIGYSGFCLIAGAVGVTMVAETGLIGSILLWTLCCLIVLGVVLNGNMMSEPFGPKDTFWASIIFSTFTITSSFIGVGLISLVRMIAS